MPKLLRLLLCLTFLLGLAALPVPAALAQDPAPAVRITQVDNSQFPTVTVYVSVTNAAGEPVPVDPGTLQIYENGQLMQASDVSGQGDIGPLTTLFVIDTSGSMEKSGKMQGARDAANAYIEQMRAGDQAGLVSFDTQVTVVQPPTTDKAALKQAVDSLQPVGNTAMFDALVQGVDTLKDVAGRKAIILLSDGLDNRSLSTVDDVINAIGPAGLSISTIGLGDPGQPGTNWGLDESALKSLAERAGGVYGFATAPAELLALYQQRGRALQNEFSLSYVSPSPLRNGLNRNLEIKFGGAAEAVTTTGRYNPGGVLPEVASRSWPLFAAVFLALALLLALPFLISRGAQAFGGSGGGKGGTGKSRSGQSSSRNSPAKGRVRLK
jgi:Ca-activated chloride channel family protein